MPQPPTIAILRPGTAAGYSGGYLGGFDVYGSAGPLDGIAVVTLWAQGRPGAWLLGPGLAAMLGQANTYYGGGKAAAVLAAAGISTSVVGGQSAGPGTPLCVINSDLVAYQVLAADVVAQAAAVLALCTNGANCNKGGNP